MAIACLESSFSMALACLSYCDWILARIASTSGPLVLPGRSTLAVMLTSAWGFGPVGLGRVVCGLMTTCGEPFGGLGEPVPPPVVEDDAAAPVVPALVGGVGAPVVPAPIGGV